MKHVFFFILVLNTFAGIYWASIMTPLSQESWRGDVRLSVPQWWLNFIVQLKRRVKSLRVTSCHNYSFKPKFVYLPVLTQDQRLCVLQLSSLRPKEIYAHTCIYQKGIERVSYKWTTILWICNVWCIFWSSAGTSVCSHCSPIQLDTSWTLVKVSDS